MHFKVILLTMTTVVLETQCYINSMKELIEELKNDGEIASELVASTLLKVDRADFCEAKRPYENEYRDIGFKATLEAPSVHSTIMEVLENHLKDPHRSVLILGVGSGYLAVCIALMIGEDSKIFAVEENPELIKLATHNIMKNHAELLNGTIKFVQENDIYQEGHLKDSPYDVIYVSKVLKVLPLSIIKNQLNAFGRFVGATGKDEPYLTVVDKDEYGKLVANNLSRLSIKPLAETVEKAVEKDSNSRKRIDVYNKKL